MTVTTAWVLMELANALSAPAHRRQFVEFLNKSRANPHVVIYEAARELFDEGVELYRTRQDKHWSLTDCISYSKRLAASKCTIPKGALA